MFAFPLLTKFLGGTAEGGRLRGHGFGSRRGGRQNESERVIRKGGSSKPFINLSSIGAFVRHVFASK
jgi:hypothetical protein